jgi:hypothetical protein
MKLLSFCLSSLLLAGSAVASNHNLNAFKRAVRPKPAVEKRESYHSPIQRRFDKRASTFLTNKTQRMSVLFKICCANFVDQHSGSMDQPYQMSTSTLANPMLVCYRSAMIQMKQGSCSSGSFLLQIQMQRKR